MQKKDKLEEEYKDACASITQTAEEALKKIKEHASEIKKAEAVAMTVEEAMHDSETKRSKKKVNT